jgi:hypothetical protein
MHEVMDGAPTVRVRGELSGHAVHVVDLTERVEYVPRPHRSHGKGLFVPVALNDPAKHGRAIVICTATVELNINSSFDLSLASI